MNIFNRVTTLRGYAHMFDITVQEVAEQVKQGLIIASKVEGTNDYLIQLPEEKVNELDKIDELKRNQIDDFFKEIYGEEGYKEPVEMDLNEYFTITYKDTPIRFKASFGIDDRFRICPNGTATTYISGSYNGESGYNPMSIEVKINKSDVDYIESIRNVDEQLRNKHLAGLGEREVVIMVDGNNHGLYYEDGKRVGFKTIIKDNFVSVEKCLETVEKIKERYNYQPKQLEFLLSLFTKTPNNEGDHGEQYLLNKRVTYDVAQNVLDVYIDGRCVYQNYNGEEWKID